LRISCGVRYISNSLSRDFLISTPVRESIPSSAKVEFTLTVFRSWIPAKKFLVLKDADIHYKCSWSLKSRVLGAGGYQMYEDKKAERR
jgi:hypothetical protein